MRNWRWTVCKRHLNSRPFFWMEEKKGCELHEVVMKIERTTEGWSGSLSRKWNCSRMNVDECDKLRRQRKKSLESEGWWKIARWSLGSNMAEKRLDRIAWEWKREWKFQAAAMQQGLLTSLSLFSSLSWVWSKMRRMRKIRYCTGFSG